MSVSIASEQSAVAARTGKPFTFTRKRGSAEDEFFPGAGSTLHFANRDTDTFTARGVPAGLLQPGDEVTVKYNNATVFKGEVSRILDRHGRGDERTQDVTVSGPWDQLGRLVFKQTWGNQTVNFSSSRVILGQTAAGAAQTMAAQIAEIATYAAQYCDMALASSDNHAPSMCLPLDEARDITCADAIRRELRFFPKLVVRFDYSSGTPALQIVDPAHADAASYMASIPMADREYTYNAHPVKYVDVTVDAVEIAVNGDAASFHQEYPEPPSGTTPSPLDILHVTIPLAKGGGSTTSESFKIETEPLPGQSDSPYVDLNDKNWWKAKHPRLENVVANDIAISNGARSDSGETNVYQRILKNAKDEVEAAGKHCRFTRFTCKCTITTTDYEEEDIFLSMDFLTTDATTRTYTVQTGSTATAGEELPAGLAQALYEQRSQSLVSEAVTVRLGASFPKLGDKLVETVGNATETLYLQSFDVDCYDLTARLSFGQPEHLSAEDMKSLLNGFRQRGSASTAVLREQKGAAEGNEPDAPGGIPPIASSEWAPGTKVKDVVKKDGGGAVKINATSAGEIDLNTADLNASGTRTVTTAKFRNLTYTDANGNQQTVRILATAAATIPATTSQGTPAQIPLSDDEPADPVLDHNGTTQGTADPGTANEAARADHVHKLPATVVDTVNAQTISGVKVFREDITVRYADSDARSTIGHGSMQLRRSVPYIDFHYDSASTYTSRIIESAQGVLVLQSPGHARLNEAPITDSSATGYNANQIDTVGAANDRFVDKTSAQTISGVKVFREDITVRYADSDARCTIGHGSMQLRRSVPYIDFHYDSASTYTSRIIESAQGVLVLQSPGHARLNEAPITDSSATGYNANQIDTVGAANARFAKTSHTHAVADITGATTIDVITGISFAFDNSTHQLVATLTKKTLTVIASANANSGTADMPLYQQNVAVSGSYSTSTHKLSLNVLGGVRTSSSASTTPSDITTATAHTAEQS